MISANNPHAKDVPVIIKEFQSLCTRCGRKPRFHINFSESPDFKVSLQNTSANKRFVSLWLIKPPYQRPYLEMKNSNSENNSVQNEGKNPITQIITIYYPLFLLQTCTFIVQIGSKAYNFSLSKFE